MIQAYKNDINTVDQFRSKIALLERQQRCSKVLLDVYLFQVVRIFFDPLFEEFFYKL